MSTQDLPVDHDASLAGGHAGRLVVGVDGSPGSLAALQWALAEAQLRGAGLHLVMAWRHPASYGGSSVWTMMMDRVGTNRQTMADAARTEIARIGKDAGKGAELEPGKGQSAAIAWEAIEGHPAAVLLRAAEGAGALVLGQRGHGGFPGVLLGSVSQQILAHARCPVVLVPGSNRERADAPVAHSAHRGGRIVVGVDGSAGSKAALKWAVTEAQMSGSWVDALIAWERIKGPGATNGWAVGTGGPSDAKEPIESIAKAELVRIAEEAARGSRVKINCRAVEGHPAQVLVENAADAAVLVVGSRGHAGFVSAVLGSVSQHVVAHARCPVALIPEAVIAREF
ncbi:MAG TPA: universal stress protein [Micrococcaceae bacterium]|nr:universal stress protein [Micrococcaceae bacterium]